MFYPPKTEGPSATDLAQRLGLHHVPGRREWRGTCPLCSYDDALVLSERQGRPRAWCASCGDKAGLGELMRGAGVLPRELDPEAEARADAQRARARDAARRLWSSGEPVPGTPAELYLRSRRIEHIAASPALRFRSDAPHPSAAHLPALLALIVDVNGKPQAVHRTFLSLDGTKASVEPVKATLAPLAGGCIRIGPSAPEIAIGEGIESSAAAGLLLGLPAWSAVSCGNLARHVVLPPEVERVTIAADRDDPGIRAANEAARRWRAEGRHVRIAMPDRLGDDFADVLARRDGAPA